MYVIRYTIKTISWGVFQSKISTCFSLNFTYSPETRAIDNTAPKLRTEILVNGAFFPSFPQPKKKEKTKTTLSLERFASSLHD